MANLAIIIELYTLMLLNIESVTIYRMNFNYVTISTFSNDHAKRVPFETLFITVIGVLYLTFFLQITIEFNNTNTYNLGEL